MTEFWMANPDYTGGLFVTAIVLSIFLAMLIHDRREMAVFKEYARQAREHEAWLAVKRAEELCEAGTWL